MTKLTKEDYKKVINDGYLFNLYVSPRENAETLFKTDENGLKVFLNGYAIIPLEEYIELTGKDVICMFTGKPINSESIQHEEVRLAEARKSLEGE